MENVFWQISLIFITYITVFELGTSSADWETLRTRRRFFFLIFIFTNFRAMFRIFPYIWSLNSYILATGHTIWHKNIILGLIILKKINCVFFLFFFKRILGKVFIFYVILFITMTCDLHFLPTSTMKIIKNHYRNHVEK